MMKFPFFKKKSMIPKDILFFNQVVDSIFPEYSRANKNKLINCSKSTVYACCSMIASDGARVPLKLYTTKPSAKSSKINNNDIKFLKSDKSGVAYRLKSIGDEVQEVTEHPALARLWNPNGYSSYNKLLAQTIFHLELAGDSYWYLVQGGTKPAYIHVMPPEDASIKELKGEKIFRQIDKYMFGMTEYTPDEIIHFMMLSAKSDAWKSGMSPLESVLDDYALMEQIKALRSTLAKTKPGTSFYIEWDKDAKVTPDQQIGIKKAITEYRNGMQKFDETLSIPGGQLKPIPMIGSDIPFQTDIELLRELIANAYKVPITKFKSASNRAERDVSNVEYYSSAVTPVLIELSETLNSFYLPMFPDTDSNFFAFSDCIPNDETIQMRVDTGYVSAGIKNINEIRYDRNFGEAIDGGDEHYIPANMMAIGNESLAGQVRTIIDEVMKQVRDK